MTRWTPRLAPRVRALAAAAAVAAAAFGLPAHLAHAADNAPADPGVRCAAKLGPGEYEFYLPGAKVTDVDGTTWVCGPDGQWFRDYALVASTPPAGTRGLRATTAVSGTLQR